MPTLNWNDMIKQEKEARTPAPAGRYVLKVRKAEWTTTAKTKAPMLRLILDIDEGGNKGKSVFDYITFDANNPGSFTFAFDKLRKLGIDPGEFGQLNEAQQCDTLVGRRVEGELIIDNYKGQDGNKLKSYVKPVGGTSSSGVGTPPPAAAPKAPVNPVKTI